MHLRSDPTSSSPRRQQQLVSPRALDYSGAAVIFLYMGLRVGVILDNTQCIRCSFPQTHMQLYSPYDCGGTSAYMCLLCAWLHAIATWPGDTSERVTSANGYTNCRYK